MVVSKQPVGDHPVDFRKVKLEGTWAKDGNEEHAEDYAFVIKDRKKGTMVVFDGDDEHEIIVRQTGDTVFVNLKEKEEDHYAWGVLVLKANRFHVLMPDADEFSALLRQERVPGIIIQEEDIDPDGNIVRSGATIIVDDPSGKWVNHLVAGKLGDPFVHEDPETFKRVRGPLP